MKIIVRNVAEVPNKYIRHLKYKLYALKEKFADILYAQVFLTKEGNGPIEYTLKLVIGLPGPDLVFNQRSSNIGQLVNASVRTAQRQVGERSL